MENVNQAGVGVAAPPASKRRVQICVRVCPETEEFLSGMKFKNNGRALDALVRAVQRGEIRDMIDSGVPLKLRDIS